MKYCPVYKKCGGCAFINTEYEDQLKAKRQYVENLYPDQKVEPMIGMEDPYHYRHKVYATFDHNRDGKIRAGLYEESTHRVVDSEMCLIQNVKANDILKSMCHIATDMHIESYDENTGRGSLRHAYIRISHASGDVLLVIVIGSKDLPGSREYVSRLRKEHPEIKTIILNYNHDFTSMILGKKEKVLYGPGYITDTIDGVSFRISSRSFYQVNPVQTEKLYGEALKMADLKKTDNVLDMCCGIGTISLLAARKARYVLGVEINPHAIRDAQGNAERNHISNVDFIAEDGERFIKELGDAPDTVFLDPPRAGFSEGFMKTLERLNPAKIVYISCNPETQARDLKVIEDDYEIQKIQPVDMFPFTKAVECVSLVTRREHKKKENHRKSASHAGNRRGGKRH